ncbi:MAG: AAA family ATPase [Nanoarchaeota archaeon]|nr:AAA family ATPase [Nanoarchaeota archaeon]
MKKRWFKKIYQVHEKTLIYKDAKNKKLIICFSGVPASGKTTLAKILEKRYMGIRLNKDDIGNIILKLNLVNETDIKEGFSSEYIIHLLKNYPLKNKLIILDKSIDRDYKTLFNILKKYSYPIFLIRLKISREKMIKRINKRNNDNLEAWIKKVDKWFFDFIEANKHIKPDFVYNNKDDLNELFFKLDRIIKN